MIILYSSYIQNLEHNAIAEALTLNMAPKTYRWYIDDTHARFKYQELSREFLKIFSINRKNTFNLQ